MSDNQQRQPGQPHPPTALNNPKLNLATPCPGAQGKTSVLKWRLVQNNPRIEVWTNDPQDQDKQNGKLGANLDMPNFRSLLIFLRQAIAFRPTETETHFSRAIDCVGYTFFGGQRSQEPKVLSTVKVGKDKEGVVWIGVFADNRPRIPFPFVPGNWHVYRKGDGSPLTKAETSMVYAEAYAEMLGQMSSHIASENYVPPPPRDNNGGGYNRGGGGGYNRGGGQGGGGGGNYNRGGGGSQDGGARTDSGPGVPDDDIPF